MIVGDEASMTVPVHAVCIVLHFRSNSVARKYVKIMAPAGLLAFGHGWFACTEDSEWFILREIDGCGGAWDSDKHCPNLHRKFYIMA